MTLKQYFWSLVAITLLFSQSLIAQSTPTFTVSFVKVGNDIAVSFPSQVGKQYKVQRSSSASGPWVDVSPLIKGTGTKITFIDHGAGLLPGSAYWRGIEN